MAARKWGVAYHRELDVTALSDCLHCGRLIGPSLSATTSNGAGTRIREVGDGRQARRAGGHRTIAAVSASAAVQRSNAQ